MQDSYERREFNRRGAAIVVINALAWGGLGGLVGRWLRGDPLDLPWEWAAGIGAVFPFCIGPIVLLTVGPLVGAAFFTTWRRVQ
jgi:hypothetical protein